MKVISINMIRIIKNLKHFLDNFHIEFLIVCIKKFVSVPQYKVFCNISVGYYLCTLV